MSYVLHILILVCLYGILSLSLNLVVGYGGLLALSHAAFYGIGAYGSTLLMTRAGWPFEVAVLAGVLVAGSAAWLLASASIRLHGDFFVLATMGYQVIVYSVLYNWMDLTGGSYGISAPKPTLLGQRISSIEGFFLLTACAASLAWWVIARLTTAGYGRTLQAVRDDEMAAQALGKDVAQFRRSAFVISGMLAALAGVLYAGHAGSFDPTSFSIEESIFVLCAVIIGGAGNVQGPLIGGVVVVLLPQLLLFLPIPDAVAASVRQILYGLLLVLMMRFRPQGIAGRYAFD